MHKIPIPHIRLTFHSNLCLSISVDGLFAALELLGNKPLSLSEMLAEILDDESRLGENNRFLSFGLELENGRFAEWVDFFEFRGCEEIWLAFEGFEGVLEVEGFEEPEDTLGAGFLEPFQLGLY